MNHDTMLSTRVESISSIKFFKHLQLGDAVFHSHTYRQITLKNHHTDAYAQQGEIRYWQTEVFFMVVKDVDSVLTCGAVLAQMPKRGNILPVQYQATLGFPVNHIVPIYIVCLGLIVDACIYIFIIHQLFSLVRDWPKRITWANIPQFLKPMNNKHNSLPRLQQVIQIRC